MKTRYIACLPVILLCILQSCGSVKTTYRTTENFDNNWKFFLGNIENAQDTIFDDSKWRTLNVPHDWSIEGEFSDKNPASPGGGALPGGIGWYRKAFSLSENQKGKLVFIDFDGVYCNSEVWINGFYLGKRPYGYSSFRYDLTSHLHYGNKSNVIAVKVDNSQQPNSRWYSGSGIYRNVWLVITDKVFVDHWGTFITTPVVSSESAKVSIKTTVKNTLSDKGKVNLITTIYDSKGGIAATSKKAMEIPSGTSAEIAQDFTLANPILWSVSNPDLYKASSLVEVNGKVCDEYETSFGIRYFEFNADKGFLLNGKPLKILGVCDHHDLGCLGSAINTRALERQLEILKSMGCNGIRTSHNPPAPELLQLCDKMGFIVMDEAFDMWKTGKNKLDYHLAWDEWHKRDLEDQIMRDRNHPSVFMWSIGNEIPEQGVIDGATIGKELSAIVKSLDTTRPVTSACNNPGKGNYLIESGALDVIGYNYHEQSYVNFHKDYPGKKFVASETTSALATRGKYDMPADTLHIWPDRWDRAFTTGNADFTCSAYDNCRVPWGSTHEATWKVIKKYEFLSGLFIWTGFDYLGEPTPYWWPARSSYFGIIDLAGFPKDAYYMYQSEWTNKPVLHIFPHWNWKAGQVIDIWAYSNSEEVELFLNDKSLGTKKKIGDDLHLSWKVPFEAGTLKAVSRTGGKTVLTQEIKTAGAPARILLEADRSNIQADGRDLSFVKVTIVDKDGIMVPTADNRVKFQIEGAGTLAGVDNGDPISHESFKASDRKAMNGLCLAILKSTENAGKITMTATSEGLEKSTVTIETK
jgi:beta-galactosidase